MKTGAESHQSAEENLYWFSKDKLPRGLSYPLKRSAFDSVLRQEQVYGAVYSVRFLAGRCPLLLNADYTPLGAHVHQKVIGRSLITLWAVPSESLQDLERRISADGLPGLCTWLRKTQNATESWRSMTHSIDFILEEGKGGIRAVER